MTGLTPEEAAKRLKAQGVEFEIKRLMPRKRVLGKTEARVMRVREKEFGLELLVGEFRVFDCDKSDSEEHI